LIEYMYGLSNVNPEEEKTDTSAKSWVVGRKRKSAANFSQRPSEVDTEVRQTTNSDIPPPVELEETTTFQFMDPPPNNVVENKQKFNRPIATADGNRRKIKT
jgi:hypothetical protein